jgi:hypothetical protein
LVSRLSQVAALEDENSQLLYKYAERLDKLIAAENTIRELSEQVANMEKERFETRQLRVVELPTLDEDG